MSTTIGRAGEFLTASILTEIFGFECFIVNRNGFDLLVFSKNRHIRVEVKTTAKVVIRRRSFAWQTQNGSSIKTHLNADHYDICAFVALPLRKVIFRHSSEITAKTTRVYISKFKELDEKETWELACAKLKK